MIIKIAVTFSVREARALVEEYNRLFDLDPILLAQDQYPVLAKLKALLESPLTMNKTQAPPLRAVPEVEE
jgi:hypothetical protein